MTNKSTDPTNQTVYNHKLLKNIEWDYLNDYYFTKRKLSNSIWGQEGGTSLIENAFEVLLWFGAPNL